MARFLRTLTQPIKMTEEPVFELYVHLVFVTTYHRCVVTKEILWEPSANIHQLLANFEAKLIEFDGQNPQYPHWSIV